MTHKFVVLCNQTNTIVSDGVFDNKEKAKVCLEYWQDLMKASPYTYKVKAKSV